MEGGGDAVEARSPTPFGDELAEASSRGAKNVRGEPLFLARTEWRVTAKPGKLFFTFFDEPRAPFELPAMKNAVKRAYLLQTNAPVNVTTEGGREFEKMYGRDF